MKIKTKIFLVFFILTFSISSIISYLYYRNAVQEKFEELRADITSIAKSAALIIDESEHSAIVTPEFEYLELRIKLKMFRDCYPKIRRIYTLRKTPKRNILEFVIDTGRPKDEGGGKISGKEDIASIGEKYDVTRQEQIQQAFEGPVADTKLVRDEWGAWLSAYAPVYDKNGKAAAIVGMDVSAKTIEAERQKLQKRIFVIFGISIILSFFTSYFLANSFTGPILHLIQNTRLISQGKYVCSPLNETRKDEIGDLTGSINEMAGNIKNTVDQLRTLHRTGEILALTLDIEESLRVSMNLSMEILGATRGLIFHYSKSTGKIAFGTSHGIEIIKVVFNELFIGNEKILLEPDDIFIDYVTEKPGIYSYADTEKIPQLSQIREWLKKTHTSVFMPFIIKDELRGFILLDVTITDNEFLRTLVNQIGMSVENARLYHEAIIDGLTGLYVHRYFEIQLAIERKRAFRFGKNLSILMLDIDFFKKFNDTYGHQAGDYVLREVSSIIKMAGRAADIVSRYGGEEIAIILPETDINGAYVIAEKIRTRIEGHDFIYLDKRMRVTVSIGVAAMELKNLMTSEKMVSHADEALYAAKEKGRNRVCMYGEKVS